MRGGVVPVSGCTQSRASAEKASVRPSGERRGCSIRRAVTSESGAA
jgi:hypothetical protein